MRVQCVLFWFLWIFVWGLWCPLNVGSNETSMEEANPRLELSLSTCQPTTEDIVITLLVTNTGSHRLVLPHLTDKHFQQYGGWWGWSLSVKKREPYGFFQYPFERPPFLTQEELIVLNPGESFITSINITDTRQLYPYTEENKDTIPPKLSHVEGEYTVNIRLRIQNEILPPARRNDGIWNGEVESNTVNFVLSYEKDEFVCTQEQQHTEE